MQNFSSWRLIKATGLGRDLEELDGMLPAFGELCDLMDVQESEKVKLRMVTTDLRTKICSLENIIALAKKIDESTAKLLWVAVRDKRSIVLNPLARYALTELELIGEEVEYEALLATAVRLTPCTP